MLITGTSAGDEQPLNPSLPGPTVTAVVVAYGPSPTLSRGVEALLASEGVEIDVVVVDNGATEGAVERLPQKDNIRTIAAPNNLGFGGGCNLGVSLARGDIVVFVNPDAVVAPGAVAALASAVAEQEVGIASASVRLLGDPGAMNSAGGAIHFLGLGWATGYGEPASRYADYRDVAAASGAGMAMRREVFEDLRGFTEELFLYHEDAELSLRCWMSGRRVCFVPEARIDHDYEFSRHGQKLYFLERNRLVMLATCYQRRTLLLLSPVLIAYEVGMAAIALRQGWARDKIRGWWWLWQHRRWIRWQRAQVQGRRQVGDRVLVPLLASRFDAPAMPVGAAIGALDRCLGAYWSIIRRIM